MTTSHRQRIIHHSNGAARPPSKLQLAKWILVGLFGFSVIVACVVAAFVIGLLLAIPLAVGGLVWLLVMAVRGKIRIRRGFP